MARIFIAIRFNDDVKNTFVNIQNALRTKGVRGNYCHLTLAFIGEKYDLQNIYKAVSEVTFKPFTMTLGELGTFPTKTGVIWCGIKEKEHVTTVANKLRERLTANDVGFSAMTFYPHISLVRQPSTIVTDIDVPETSITVDRLFVMKSERIDRELVYSEI